MAADHRTNNIDALRLLLSLLVLFSHSFPLAMGNESAEPLFWLSAGRETLGSLSVDWFFILSGYLITQSWERSTSAWSFLKKRICRIYPGYLVAVSVCLWVVVPLSRSEGYGVCSWSTLAGNLWPLLTLRGFPSPHAFLTNPYPEAVNGSLWSISYEFCSYLVLMMLGSTVVLSRRRLILGLFIASVLLHFFLEKSNWAIVEVTLRPIIGDPRIWARVLRFYLAGVTAYLYRDRIVLNRWWALLALVGLIFSAATRGFLFAGPTLGTYLLLYLAFTNDWQWRTASKYGDFSYGIYLYAFPIQQVIMLMIGHRTNPFLLFALALLPTVLAGVLSWYLVERWFLRKMVHNRVLLDPPAKASLSVSGTV